MPDLPRQSADARVSGLLDALVFSGSTSPVSLLDVDALMFGDAALDISSSEVIQRGSDTVERPPYLGTVVSSSSVAQYSADLILESLYAIPEQMRRRETFPPFIHGHWCQYELPEPLAICVQVANMYSSASYIRNFVWRSILAEQQRAVQRLAAMDGREVLAETQVGMVYLIMRLVDGVSTLR